MTESVETYTYYRLGPQMKYRLLEVHPHQGDFVRLFYVPRTTVEQAQLARIKSTMLAERADLERGTMTRFTCSSPIEFDYGYKLAVIAADITVGPA